MNARAAAPDVSSAPEWFVSWFDSAHYQRLYAHRDAVEAARLIDRLIGRLRPPDGAAVLDLGCGTGRHSRYLASRGFDVTGLDLSAAAIRQARQSESPSLRFIRQDMRLPFRTRAFDYVFSLFTSFGYFEDPADDVTVAHNIAASLKAGGILVLYFLNILHAEAYLAPEETIERDGVVYCLSRWADAGHIFKRIVIDDRRSACPLEHVERVAKLTIGDFRFMFALCDMTIEETYGDYDLAPFDAQTSPRLILVVRKSAAPSRVGLPAGQVPADPADGFGRHAEVRREH